MLSLRDPFRCWVVPGNSSEQRHFLFSDFWAIGPESPIASPRCYPPLVGLCDGALSLRWGVVVQDLISAKADLHARDSHGRTPMHCAAEKSSVATSI